MRRLACFAIVVLVLLSSVAFAQTDSPRNFTVLHDLKAQLAPLTLGSGTQYVAGVGVRLAGSALSGSVNFAGIDAPFATNNAVPSWNVDMPAGTGIRIEIRAVNGGSSTSWYEVARQGTTPLAKKRTKSDKKGYIDIDTLMLNARWPRIEYRTTLYSNTAGVTPTLRLMSLCYADTTTRIAFVAPPDPGVQVSLPVPWRSQYWVPGIGGVICGPTSMSMAEEFLGVNLPTETVAADCYDDYNKLYGNWPFICQAAAKRGLKAFGFRCNNQAALRAELEAGHPVILSVAWGAGELTNAPITSTGGHLILCVGYTANGDYIINDPAGADSRWDHVIYNKTQMAHVWGYHGGGFCMVVTPQ